ncbi:MAG TPA: hypothetical protein EYP10_04920, partial [Armatimonadetes bacterium]|nr:hypothetical protein [Armatimonadota bacterium]
MKKYKESKKYLQFLGWIRIPFGKERKLVPYKKAEGEYDVDISPPQVIAIASGFRMKDRNERWMDEPTRQPYEGSKVKWVLAMKVRFMREKKWYSWEDMKRGDLKKYVKFCAWNSSPFGKSVDEGNDEDVLVRKMPRALMEILNARVSWLKFENIVSHSRRHGNGTARWYGMKLSEEVNGMIWTWDAIERGTHWFGVKLKYRQWEKSTKGYEAHEWLWEYPTNFDRGEVKLPVKVEEIMEGNARKEGLLNRKEIGGHPGGVRITQIVWTLNPWNGRISVRAVWDRVNFANDDLFFDRNGDGVVSQQERQAMSEQGEFNARVMEWAHSFLGVPYSWGGQTYGGRQSSDKRHYTCSKDVD